MRRIFFLALTIGALLTGSVFAQTVEVVGEGADKESAVRDAMRNAIEQAIGTLIDSRTLTGMGIVKLDEIYTQSQGFVKDIKILKESKSEIGYRINASVEVDTNPDSQLRNRLAMLMSLNDPRIGVFIMREQEGEDGYLQIDNDTVCEAALIEQLVEMGFNHVKDVNILLGEKKETVLNSIYNGEIGLISEINRGDLDYLILGKSSADSNKIYLPGNDGEYRETFLNNSRASLDVKILKFDTAEITAGFSVEGSGVEQSEERARRKAEKDVGLKAAALLAQKLQNVSSKINGNVQIQVSNSKYDDIEKVADRLRSMVNVQRVYIREYKNNSAVIDVATELRPHVILEILREDESLNIFVDSISSNILRISVF